MIKQFRDKESEQLWQGQRVGRFQALQQQALRRLDILHAATSLDDLRLNPGNHFKALAGDHNGQFSIRINKQWRVCCEWDGNDARNVEITDNH